MGTTLGLDLGTNSIGWALIDEDISNLINTGVRIFPEGVNIEKGKEESKNATRRDKRQIRRQLYRRKFRKRLVAKELIKLNMFPAIENLDKELNKIVLNDDLKEFFSINPYLCRKKAYQGKKLSLFELGRIFYQFSQRRGYKENLKADTDEDGKIYEGKPKEGITGIKETKGKIQEFGTLGNYLGNENPHEKRLRNRYTTRTMYLNEFNDLWEKQKQFYPELLTDELKNKIGDPETGLLFYQRPLRSQKHLIGKCTFEPNKPKAPKSSIPFEDFRMYQYINSFEIAGKKLEEDERRNLLELFNSKKIFKFKDILKKLNKVGDLCNYDEDDKINGNNTIINFIKIFGKERWSNFSDDEKNEIWNVKYFAKDEEWLKKHANEKWNLDDDKIDKLIKFNLKDEYANLSRKAINNILPFLKKGYVYNIAVLLGGIRNAFGSDKWKQLNDEQQKTIEDTVESIATQIESAGKVIDEIKEFLSSNFGLSEKQLVKLYHHSLIDRDTDLKEKLTEPENVRNPIVQQALYEVKNLVNAIIDKYGKPDHIKIELARDLKSSKQKRLDDRYKIKENEDRNDKIKLRLDEYNIPHTRTNIHKVLLWDECQHTCPYTGEKIGFQELFDDGYVQLEHIVPFSVSLNNSLQNKTLCLADENRAKGDKTPYQFYGNNEAKWTEVKNLAYKLLKGNYNKYKRFINKEIDDTEKFIERQLNDTRYISKLTKNYLKNICPDVMVVQGTTTAILRHYWGLDTILSDIYEVGDLEDGEYFAAINQNNKIEEIVEWDKDSKKKIIDSLKKKGVVLNGNVKDGTFYPRKNRDDHRHHAIDAITVAATKRNYLQKISTLHARGMNVTEIKEKTMVPHPWDNFRTDVVSSINSILVSHKKIDRIITPVKKKVFDFNGKPVKKDGKIIYHQGIAARGELHKETIFGKRKDNSGDEAYHFRKPIEEIKTGKQLEKIVDEKIKCILRKRLNELGVDTKSKSYSIPNEAFFKTNDSGEKIPLVFLPNKNGKPVPIKKVRTKENLSNAERLKDVNQYVNPRNNHHVLIYVDNNDQLNEDVVSFWKVVERKTQKQTVFQLPPDGKSIVTTLQVNDLFLLGLSEDQIDLNNLDYELISDHLYRVQKFTSGDYYFRKHVESTIDGPLGIAFQYIKNFGDGKTGWLSFNPIKVRLNCLGEIEIV